MELMGIISARLFPVPLRIGGLAFVLSLKNGVSQLGVKHTARKRAGWRSGFCFTHIWYDALFYDEKACHQYDTLLMEL